MIRAVSDDAALIGGPYHGHPQRRVEPAERREQPGRGRRRTRPAPRRPTGRGSARRSRRGRRRPRRPSAPARPEGRRGRAAERTATSSKYARWRHLVEHRPARRRAWACRQSGLVERRRAARAAPPVSAARSSARHRTSTRARQRPFQTRGRASRGTRAAPPARRAERYTGSQISSARRRPRSAGAARTGTPCAWPPAPTAARWRRSARPAPASRSRSSAAGHHLVDQPDLAGPLAR